jgi:hypothetical protein
MAQIAQPSTVLAGAFAATCRSSRRYDAARLNNLLICYRYFKSLRNSIAHQGGKADQAAERAYQDFAAIATTANLGTTAVPAHHPVVAGGDIKLELRGVTGLGDIVLRIVTTYDAMLSETDLCEKELLARLPRWAKKEMLPGDKKRRAARITKIFDTARVPVPTVTVAFEAFLKANQFLGPW